MYNAGLAVDYSDCACVCLVGTNKYRNHWMFFFFSFSASLTQAVRNFAKGLEGWLINSLEQIPKKMADVKVSVSI